MSTLPLLDVRGLTVEFVTRNGTVTAVRGIDLTVAKGETVGIVGEFGIWQVRDVLCGHANSRPCGPASPAAA